jgi:hypothetical protein
MGVKSGIMGFIISFQRKYFINNLLGGVGAIRVASYLCRSFTVGIILLGREKLLLTSGT